MVEGEGKLYTLDEAAGILGVARRTVLRWCREDRIDFFNPAKRYFRVSERAIEKFLLQGRVEGKTKTQGAGNGHRGK